MQVLFFFSENTSGIFLHARLAASNSASKKLLTANFIREHGRFAILVKFRYICAEFFDGAATLSSRTLKH
jgi:hypothetical protein